MDHQEKAELLGDIAKMLFKHKLQFAVVIKDEAGEITIGHNGCKVCSTKLLLEAVENRMEDPKVLAAVALDKAKGHL